MRRFAIVALVLAAACGDQDAFSPEPATRHTAVFAQVASHGCTYNGSSDSYDCVYEFGGLEEGSTWDVWLRGEWYYYQCVNIHNGRPSRRATETVVNDVQAAAAVVVVDGVVSGSAVIPPPTAPTVSGNPCQGNNGPFTEVLLGLAPAGWEILLVTPLPGPS